MGGWHSFLHHLLLLVILNNNNLQMTTFERFQRNARSHISQSSRLKSPRNDYTALKIRELVTFSDKILTFRYYHDLNTCKAALRINNMSGSRIHFKVRSNNPSVYQVSPYQQIIQDQAEITISFVFLHTKQPLNRMQLNKDKFEIVWGKLSNVPGERSVLSESKMFPVKILQIPEHSIQNKARSQSIQSPSQINSASLIKYPGHRYESEHETLLRKQIIIAVSIISFILGFLLT